MKEIILKIIQADSTLEIKRELWMCKITVKKDFKPKTSNKYVEFICEQILPLDDHMDYALEGCIQYCLNNIMEQIAQYK